jgi:hypothetical protein
MPWVYTFITVCAGLFFYWLRNNHRIVYGTSEIIAALALMYVVYFPHGGNAYLLMNSTPPTFLDILTSRAVAFFASVYGFVRGCDNIVTGLRNGSNI